MASLSIDFSVFLAVSPIVQVHSVAGLAALALTPTVLWRQRRDRLHKVSGYIWVAALAVLALSSFGISGIGTFGWLSPLHGLAVLTLGTLVVAIRAVVRGDLVTHERAMRNLATFGMGLPMVLNFLPGRTFSKAVFGANPTVGLWSMATIFAAILIWRFWRGRLRSGFSALPAE
ncbi:hypothetical protein TRM7557_00366 [Tritonibacter multivorans]|uniref:DUF2306 domain-containing protein n=1 Tax=Tritonibacter multivorans TaxID=928856 RepID=A0A0P1G0X4_9RHOB|nr:DUF2306 domain-containing protein [Tritonibacter multivorans]MDA7419405.1 DUF2306 domain-containing protein [Tritonibacter multivorans]CUH75394.1 hypothetical protein TRM7557_00366 [Tritonibacter multivorans]SFC68313.1 Uncharacterized membrane protein [Tritonibacter multivorans]